MVTRRDAILALSAGYLWPWNTLYAAMALLTWLFLTPDFAKMSTFAVGWISIIFFRNLMLIALYVSAWHLRLYVRRAQGTDYKYDRRWLATNNPTFLFQFVERGIQGTGPDLQNVVRHLLETMRKSPSMRGLQRQDSENKQTQRTLNEVIRLHGLIDIR